MCRPGTVSQTVSARADSANAKCCQEFLLPSSFLAINVPPSVAYLEGTKMAAGFALGPGHSDRREDRRKCPRVALKYAVEIAGFDHAGRLFAEQTTTRNVSDTGCLLECLSWLESGDLFTLRRQDQSPQSTQPLIFRVVWSSTEGFGLLLGAEETQRRPLWDVRFPPGKLPGSPP